VLFLTPNTKGAESRVDNAGHDEVWLRAGGLMGHWIPIQTDRGKEAQT